MAMEISQSVSQAFSAGFPGGSRAACDGCEKRNTYRFIRVPIECRVCAGLLLAIVIVRERGE